MYSHKVIVRVIKLLFIKISAKGLESLSLSAMSITSQVSVFSLCVFIHVLVDSSQSAARRSASWYLELYLTEESFHRLHTSITVQTHTYVLISFDR